MMTQVQTWRLRIAVLVTSLSSVAMTWGVIAYGLLTNPTNSFWFFGRVNPPWGLAAFALSGIGLVLSAVSLIRRDFVGIFGLVCSLAVLSGVWARFVPAGP
jgi:hypothetical protein